MAGSASSYVRKNINYGAGVESKRCKKITISWTGDDSDGSVPDLEINGQDISGWLIKVITNPGATAPTDNYDITLGDVDDTSLDALAGLLVNRDTSTTEQVYVADSSNGATTPIFLAADRDEVYTMQWANNSVNSAVGSVVLYIVDQG